MDIQMPVMNGIDAIKELKTIPACQSIPIIAITARVMSSDVSFIDESGADDYLSKPIVGVELIKKVNKWLAVSQDKNGESKEDV
jgi:CheY-like chemotaxis protein